MGKFFISPECIKGNTALISGEEAHHILDVMRLQKGERIQAFDGRGKLYQGQILDTAHKKVKLKIETVAQDRPISNLQITLAQALPKKSKMDYIVEKATELGVDTIAPTQTARTIAKLDKENQPSRIRRWQRLALEASKQCGRTTVPQVKDLTAWPSLLSGLANFDLKLLFCLDEDTQQLKDVLRAQKKARKIALFIGPEGDFTPDEISRAKDKGCISVSLGKNVLKSDTAAVAALAMINYELND